MLFPSFTSDCHTFSLFLVQSFLPLSLSLPLYLSLSLFVALVSRSSHFPSCVQCFLPRHSSLCLGLSHSIASPSFSFVFSFLPLLLSPALPLPPLAVELSRNPQRSVLLSPSPSLPPSPRPASSRSSRACRTLPSEVQKSFLPMATESLVPALLPP